MAVVLIGDMMKGPSQLIHIRGLPVRLLGAREAAVIGK